MLRLPIFAKKKKREPPYSGYVSKGRSSWKSRRMQKTILLVIKSIPNILLKKRPIRVILLFAFFCLCVIGGRYFLFSPKFAIESIDVSGNVQLSRQYINDNIHSVIGQNIFLVRSSKIKEDVLGLSPYVKDVQVEKILPDKISITLVEREAYIVWVNFSNANLLDTEGVILEMVYDFKDLTLSEEDIDLLKGYGNIKEINEKEESAKKRKENNGNEVPGEEKEDEVLTTEETIALLDAQQLEVVAKVDNFWRNSLTKVDKRFRKYPFVYSYESKKYTAGDALESTIMSNTKLGVDISYLKKDVIRYIWESQFRFVILMTEGRKIVFSTRRDFHDQVEDLEVLMTELKKENKTFSFIDLGSRIIPVEE